MFSVLAARTRNVSGALGNSSCLACLVCSSGLDDDGDATVQLRLVESEAQAQRLGEVGGEGVEVGQAAVLPHLGEGDGARTVVHSHGHAVATHLVCEAGLPAVVPGCQPLVVLLRQTP